MTRILLIDDHEVVRQGLKQVLFEALPDAEFGEAASGTEALGSARGADWDIAILDISLPDEGGLDVLKRLRQLSPRVPVLVLSMHPEEQFAVRALRAGAAGYLSKRMAAKDLVGAVRRVLAGGKYLTPSLAERLADELGSDWTKAPHEKLSDREYEVFRLLATGMTVKEIGEQLSLSPQTVSTHRGHILDKMRMSSNSDLVRYAAQNRLT